MSKDEARQKKLVVTYVANEKSLKASMLTIHNPEGAKHYNVEFDDLSYLRSQMIHYQKVCPY